MTTLFISDLHLEAERPDIAKQFLEFMENETRDCEELYILGDLFEAWVGDDDPNTHYFTIKRALRKLVDRGVPVYFMHGNRDFMVGREFSNETGVKILEDPFRVDMYGRKVLLSHGDLLCTDDIQYQKVRKMTRDPEWQAKMRAKPLKERLRIAAEARRQSLEQTINMSLDIMDVNAQAVEKMIREHNVDVLLHGHTHRPAVHTVDLGNRRAQRIVLGDWYRQGSVVRWDSRGPRLESMPR
ncbi:MAG: UDP-2,3-diacylglucosamine diphosphatase [Woeseiaceae bacterium]